MSIKDDIIRSLDSKDSYIKAIKLILVYYKEVENFNYMDYVPDEFKLTYTVLIGDNFDQLISIFKHEFDRLMSIEERLALTNDLFTGLIYNLKKDGVKIMEELLKEVYVKERLVDALESVKTDLTGTKEELEAIVRDYYNEKVKRNSVTKSANDLLLAAVCNYLLESCDLNIISRIDSKDTVDINQSVNMYEVETLFKDKVLGLSDKNLEEIIDIIRTLVKYAEIGFYHDFENGEKKVIRLYIRSLVQELIDTTEFNCSDENAEDVVRMTIEDIENCIRTGNYENYPMLQDKLMVAVLNYFLVIRNFNFLKVAPEETSLCIADYRVEDFKKHLENFKDSFNKITDENKMSSTIKSLIEELVKFQECE